MSLRLDTEDDLLHAPTSDLNFNESRYYNFLDRDSGLGGWMRMGNRPNEGYAEMTVCLYLPDDRVAFMFRRPKIEGHTAHDSGGLRFDVVAPFVEHRVSYDGQLCLLANPREMADPSAAFAGNPHEDAHLDLRVVAIAVPYGGEPVWDDDEEPDSSYAAGFATGHTEQHMSLTGAVQIGDRRFDIIAATGLRDHSWGPRVWQSIWWYRWLTATFDNLGIACTVRGTEEDGMRHVKGHVFDVARYGDTQWVPVRQAELSSDYDEEGFPISNCMLVTTDDHTYELRGEIRSGIPLRNRRDGKVTRLTESMTNWSCEGHQGGGLTEYLDQVVDDVPVGIAAGI